MASKKKPTSKQPKVADVPVPLESAVPPPDSPRLRHAGGPDADDARKREQARKRLEALEKTRQMATDEETEPC